METVREQKLSELREIVKIMGRVLVAYSGGVDSTLLLKVSGDTLGLGNVLAVTVLSPLYPERELAIAKQAAETLGLNHRLIESNELEIEGFSRNPPNRCYFCKQELFQKLLVLAEREKIQWVVEGSTLDDDMDHRPGRKAIEELGVRSPLKEARLTKEDVRVISKALQLATWDKPSFACLASRFPYGEKITPEGLRMVGEAEDFLFALGFKQVRVRHYGKIARIEVLREEMELFLDETLREKIVNRLKKIGYTYITLDLQGFRSGSMNEVLR